MPALNPAEARKKFAESVPESIINCWNDCIVKNLRQAGNSLVSECVFDDIKNAILNLPNTSVKEAQDNGWFDLEPLFRDRGWTVKVDSPAYNESYPTTITFSAIYQG